MPPKRKKRTARSKKPAVSKEQLEQGLAKLRSPEIMYRCAEWAWRDGWTTSAMLSALSLSRSVPQFHKEVKRTLMRAHRQGVLSINPRKIKPTEVEKLQSRLESKYNAGKWRPLQFHVVCDEAFNQTNGGSLLDAMAAEIIDDAITQLVDDRRRNSEHDATDKQQKQLDKKPADHASRTSAAEDPIIITNAGGRVLSSTVAVLQRRPPLVDEEEDMPKESGLLFVALSDAYVHRRFERSPSFIAVTMAELCGAPHVALPRAMSDEFKNEHRELVRNASLVICGAGTTRGDHYGVPMQLLKELGIPVPNDAVGDLAINFLDKQGYPVSLDPRAQRVLEEINPTFSIQLLREILEDTGKRVIVILDAIRAEDKLEISRAILEQRLATDVVLGTRLAELIVPGRTRR